MLLSPFAGAVAMMRGKTVRAAANPQATSATPEAKPKRLNKCIELFEQGQPIYYTMATGGYDEGKKLAQTWADMIIYDMEHAPLNIVGLQDFMQGLVDGGPTKSGHRTPAVVPQLPVGGWDEETVQASYWMFHQCLDMGVHGIHLCHAGTPGAARVIVRSVRYPFNRIGVDPECPEGRRGSGGQARAAKIWGIPVPEYLKKADVWPLNPEGELLLGIKCEDKYALVNCEKTCAVPGLAFAEWGPGDMGMSTGNLGGHEPYPPDSVLGRAKARVFAAAKANHLYFLNSVNVKNIEDMIKAGVMIGAGNEAAAEKGRQFTKRTMPW
jgi:4-hydroxy-2-oxoheptanedioate aldolase